MTANTTSYAAAQRKRSNNNTTGISDLPLSTPVFSAAFHACGNLNSDLQAHIEVADAAARQALAEVKPVQEALSKKLDAFNKGVRESKIPKFSTKIPATRKVLKDFKDQHRSLCETLSGTLTDATKKLNHDYGLLEAEAPYITLTLFGKTRSGKSTLMEALTRGNGSSIGKGAQHTTRDVKAYCLNQDGNSPEVPHACLRVVDTPGIEGFSGEELACMANDFVSRSDHILFMMSDDKESSSELEHFRHIRTLGKDVTVLLNVKSTDENLPLLLEYPEYIFKKNELEGHFRRIHNYLDEHFDMESAHIIPVHARAAWLSVSNEELPEEIERPELLHEASKLVDVEEFIKQFIMNRALPARKRAPRDLVHSYIATLKDESGPYAARFRFIAGQMHTMDKNIKRGLKRAQKRVCANDKLVRSRFEKVNADINALVDSVIAEKCDGQDLNKR